MNRVLDRIWIGGSIDLEPRVPLRSLGFVAVVDLRDATTAVPIEAIGVAVHKVPNRDGDPWTDADVEGIFKFIGEHLRMGRVLVACAAGMSRSVSVTIGFLVRTGWSFPEAYRHVREARPEAAPVIAMLDSVLRVVHPTGFRCS